MNFTLFFVATFVAFVGRRAEGAADDGAVGVRWPPASSARATVRDLHDEYRTVFRRGNRNAASHLWASFLLDRSSQMTDDRLTLFFSGFCAVSGSPVRPSDFNRYRLTLPKVGGGRSTGYMHYCCWPCVCDVQDYVRVDTKNVTLANGIERRYHFAVIGNPCDDPEQLTAPFVQPFDGRTTSIADSAREVRCLEDGTLEGATLSDRGYVVVGMFFDSEDALTNGAEGVAAGASDDLADPTPGRMSQTVTVDRNGRSRFQDEREYKVLCEDRARKGYNSGMGEIFRKVCAVSPISDEALGLPGCDRDAVVDSPTCEL
ncbi:hypothetical protein ACHAWF_008994 [Thalassiosira exigua]